MKNRTFTLAFVFASILFTAFPNKQLYGQDCCCEIVGCVPDPGIGDCNLLCNTPGFANLGGPFPTPACIGTPCNPGPLPIEIEYFRIKVIDPGVELHWKTASELENEGFEILRASGMAMDWEVVDFVKGNGTTVESIEYTYLDKSPPPGTNYYRIKQVDFDGTFSYSDIEVAKLDDDKEIIIWPTFAKDNIVFSSSEGLHNENFQIEISGMTGRKVMEFQFIRAISLDISNLEKRHYIINATSNGSRQTLRFVKME